MLIPRVGGIAYISGPCGPFKQTLLRDWQFLLPPQPPLVFIARSYEILFALCWNLGLCGLAWGWDPWLHSCSSSFYPSHVNVELPVQLAAASASAPPQCHHHLPVLHCVVSKRIWMNVSSLNPWLLDSQTVQFSGSFSCLLYLDCFLSFLWLCKEANRVYLCLHLGRSPINFDFRLHKTCIWPSNQPLPELFWQRAAHPN